MARKRFYGFSASMLQIRRAYTSFFNEDIPADQTFEEAANRLVRCMGRKEAQVYILAQSNDPEFHTDYEARN